METKTEGNGDSAVAVSGVPEGVKIPTPIWVRQLADASRKPLRQVQEELAGEGGFPAKNIGLN